MFIQKITIEFDNESLKDEKYDGTIGIADSMEIYDVYNRDCLNLTIKNNTVILYKKYDQYNCNELRIKIFKTIQNTTKIFYISEYTHEITLKFYNDNDDDGV